jgi:hypothetical protein
VPYLTKYHLGEQQASALLGPIADALRELEQRAGHYADRLRLSDADQQAILTAHQAIAKARAEVERLSDTARQTRGSDA